MVIARTISARIETIIIYLGAGMDSTVHAAWIGFSATVITGLVAVGGAVIVGWRQGTITERQAKIADRQTDILAQQVAHADASNRIELFDRRMQTYNVTKNYLMFFIYEERTDFTRERDANFLDLSVESRFLFNEAIHDYLVSILDRKNARRLDFELFYSKAPIHDKAILEVRIMDAYSWASDQLAKLHRVFGPFLDIAPPIPVKAP